MRERVHTFGDDVRLVGVVSEPQSTGGPQPLPGIVLLNAGLLHRTGPARLNVDLGRKLCAVGFTSLRFDLSGLGDSEARRDRRSEADRAVLDIQQAIGFMGDKYGLERFVLIGLCSGADNAHLAALADGRVSGLVLLDPYGYRTAGYYLRHYGPRLLQVAPWVRFVRRSAEAGLRALSRATGQAPTERTEMFERSFAPRDQVASELQQLVDRGVDHLLVYSGGVREDYFNHRGQFRQMFPSLHDAGRVAVEYYGDADHVYTLQADRLRLVELICAWLRQRYGAKSP